MSLLVNGSIAIDTIESPFGKAERVLGGSATYFAMAASFHTPVHLVGVIGKDFPEGYRLMLQKRGIYFDSVEVSAEYPTFNWHGKYSEDMNHRETLHVDLTIFEKYSPVVPEELNTPKVLFLANASPVDQRTMLDQCKPSLMTFVDTMDIWITNFRSALDQVLARVDGVIMDQSEALMYTGENNPIKAGRKLITMGPAYAVVKKGSHGAMLFGPDGQFAAVPAFPLENVPDPTGAGDCFAGGMMGYMTQCEEVTFDHLKKALLHGTVTASYCVEGFSSSRLEEVTEKDITDRFNAFQNMVSFA